LTLERQQPFTSPGTPVAEAIVRDPNIFSGGIYRVVKRLGSTPDVILDESREKTDGEEKRTQKTKDRIFGQKDRA
jgi:hypothetical protein